MNKLYILTQPNEHKLCGLEESRIPGFFHGDDTKVIAVNPNNYTIEDDFWSGAEFIALVPSYYPLFNLNALIRDLSGYIGFGDIAESSLGDVRVFGAARAWSFRTLDEAFAAPADIIFKARKKRFLDIRTASGRMKALNQLKSETAKRLVKSGVEVLDKRSTLISPEAVIGEGTVVYPGCVIEGPTVIGRNCVVGMHSRLTNMRIADNVEIEHSVLVDSEVQSGVKIGPFAYVRPGTLLKENVKIGDFVEIKNSSVGSGTKVSHLTYIGDSDIGDDVNVGCGVVTCNYDGMKKHRSTVKDGAFIGSNVNLVSPVTIGEKAYIATGSTITHDIPDNVLAIARARQIIKEDWKRPEKH